MTTQQVQQKSTTGSKNQGFTFEEEASSSKIILTIYGDKGVGKTTAVMGLSGKKYFISFDGKTRRIADTLYKNDPDIVVLDGRKYFPNEDRINLPANGEKSVEWIEFLLDEIKSKGDAQWVVFDYLPTLAKICEMKMRKLHNLAASQGTSNRSVWEDRNIFIRRIHRKALEAVNPKLADKRCGVVYVTYVKTESVEVKDGETLHSIKKPNYTDAIEQETDIVLHARAEFDARSKSMLNQLFMESNKMVELSGVQRDGLSAIKNGTLIDLSNGKKLRDAVVGL